MSRSDSRATPHGLTCSLQGLLASRRCSMVTVAAANIPVTPGHQRRTIGHGADDGTRRPPRAAHEAIWILPHERPVTFATLAAGPASA